jgi:prevent-host-death family protein
MKTIPIYEAKNQLSKYVEMCREEPVVITKNGQMKAFLVPYDEDEFAALMLQYSPLVSENDRQSGCKQSTCSPQ